MFSQLLSSRPCNCPAPASSDPYVARSRPAPPPRRRWPSGDRHGWTRCTERTGRISGRSPPASCNCPVPAFSGSLGERASAALFLLGSSVYGNRGHRYKDSSAHFKVSYMTLHRSCACISPRPTARPLGPRRASWNRSPTPPLRRRRRRSGRRRGGRGRGRWSRRRLGLFFS